MYYTSINKIILSSLIVMLISAIMISCNTRNISDLKNKTLKIDIEDLEKKLASGHSFNREEPFVTRNFEPELNGKWIGNAVSYGCYRQGQAPGKKGPSQNEIFEDLHIISAYWNLIRVYGSDNDSERILKVIADNNLPIRVMLGVWIENEEKKPELRSSNSEQVLRGVQLANKYPEIVIALNVGNETQVFWSWHRMNQKNLIRYVRAVRNNTRIPVTTADDYNFWNKPESKKVAEEIDFIVSHMHPLWNGKKVDTAIDWIDSTYKKLQRDHPQKLIVIGETGWATNYNPNKKGPGEQGTLIKGEVSVKAQEKYLIKHNNWVNKNKITTFLFEAFDEPWKGGGESSGPDEVEKHWGVFYENRQPKASFKNYLNVKPGKSN